MFKTLDSFLISILKVVKYTFLGLSAVAAATVLVVMFFPKMVLEAGFLPLCLCLLCFISANKVNSKIESQKKRKVYMFEIYKLVFWFCRSVFALLAITCFVFKKAFENTYNFNKYVVVFISIALLSIAAEVLVNTTVKKLSKHVKA